MPVKLGSRHRPETEARIEIVPLIDIMFFLLAAFMLVSLSMVNLRSVKVNLPTASSAETEARRNLVSLSVDRAGVVYLDQKMVGPNELAVELQARQAAEPDLKVFISGDKEARHGDIIRVLNLVRGAGVQQVAFEIRQEGPSE